MLAAAGGESHEAARKTRWRKWTRRVRIASDEKSGVTEAVRDIYGFRKNERNIIGGGARSWRRRGIPNGT